MKRILVLPFGIEPREELEQADLVLGKTLGEDLARRLEVHGELDVAFVDALARSAESSGLFLYDRKLATQLAPTLIGRLDLDVVLFAEARFELPTVSVTVWAFDGDESAAGSFNADGPANLLLALNLEIARQVHEHFGVEPTERELLRIEQVSTESLEALRLFALASVLPREPEDAALQRLEVLQKAVAVDPNYAEALEDLARSSGELGMPDEALGVLEGYADAHPDEPDARLRLARTAVELGRPERAVKVAQEITTSDPWNAEAVEVLSEALLAADRAAEAAFTLREAVWRFPQQGELRLLLGQALLAQGEFRDAEEALVALHDEYPEEPNVTAAWCRALVGCGRFGLAMQHLSSLLRTQDLAGSSKLNVGELRLFLAELQLAWGAPGKALVTLDPLDPVSEAGQQGDLLREVALMTFGGTDFQLSNSPEQHAAESWSARVVHMEHLLLGNALDEAERFLADVMGQGEAERPGLRQFRIRGWQMEISLRRMLFEEAEKLVRSCSPELRVGLMNRLTWLAARAADRGDGDLLARTVGLQRAVQPFSAPLIVRAARIGFRAGQRDAALELLDTALTKKFDLLVARARCEILVLLGEGDEALEWLDEESRASGPAKAALTVLAAAAIDDRTQVTSALNQIWAEEDCALIAAIIEDVLDVHPDLAPQVIAAAMKFADETPRGRPGALALAVRLLIAAGDVEGAHRIGQRLKPQPDSNVAFALGLLASGQGDKRKAISLWETAIAEGGSAAVDSAIHLGTLLLGTEQYHKAVEILEWGFLVSSEDPAILTLLRKASAAMLAS